MPAALVTTVTLSRGRGDCAIVSLSALGGFSYYEVLAAIVRRYSRTWRPGLGLRVPQIQRVSRDLGLPLRWSDRFDEDSYGLIVIPRHVAILRNALIIESDGTGSILELDTWLEINKPSSVGVLLPTE